jgi:hypothetical protein
MKAAIDLVEAATFPHHRKVALRALRELCDNLPEDFDASRLNESGAAPGLIKLLLLRR